jgi:phosphate transport system substrate-binding protein
MAHMFLQRKDNVIETKKNYPLARFLYIYFNKKPNDHLNPLMAEFLKYVFSKQGQLIVVKDGFYPVSKALADEDLGKVGLK